MPSIVADEPRACHADAVTALESSMAKNHPRALVQMATGAGKTFTARTLSYRLPAHAGFRRVLFLADRANLARHDAEAADAVRLKQSILEAAFEGRLTEQDPAEEPASALLARLRTAEPPPRRRALGPAPRPAAAARDETGLVLDIHK